MYLFKRCTFLWLLFHKHRVHSPAAPVTLRYLLLVINLSQQWTLLLSAAQWRHSCDSENKQRSKHGRGMVRYNISLFGWWGFKVWPVKECYTVRNVYIFEWVIKHHSLFPPQLSLTQWSVNTNARCTCSSTPCWTSRKQSRPTGAAATTCSTAACVSAAAKAAAMRWATTSARSAGRATFRCTPRHEPPCLSEVSLWEIAQFSDE